MIHTYVGPTLGRSEPLLSAPSVRMLPPVRHGDFFDPAIADDDTVVVIDGVYHQAPALRHKEILAVMSRGVRVIGAASIGALRAAELYQFGMLGVGRVFQAYVRGDIDGDDEVAVGQEPGGEQRALTWPLVNLRYVLQLAQEEGVVSGPVAAGLLAELRAVYYPQRTQAAVLALCHRHRAGQVAAWLEQQRGADPQFGDLKRLDALDALHMALTGSVPRPTLPAGTAWDTAYYRRWANHFAVQQIDGLTLATSRRVSYQGLFDREFPAVWAAHLDHLSRNPGDGSAGMPLAERMAPLGGLPACLLFRPPVDLNDSKTLSRLLAHETAADRAAIARYEGLNEETRRSQPGFVPEAIDDDQTLQALLALWRTDLNDLEAAAAGRGFRNSAHALEELKNFMVGLLRDQEQRTSDRELVSE